MLKKTIALIGAGAVLLSVVAPVLAHRGRPQPVVTDTNNVTVSVSATSGAFTGLNTQSSEAEAENGMMQYADASGSQTMRTGDADSSAKAGAMINTDVSCGCRRSSDSCDCKTSEVNNVVASVAAGSEADTGINGQEKEAEAEKGMMQVATDGGSQSMTTGAASSRARSFVVVNTDVRGGH